MKRVVLRVTDVACPILMKLCQRENFGIKSEMRIAYIRPGIYLLYLLVAYFCFFW